MIEASGNPTTASHRRRNIAFDSFVRSPSGLAALAVLGVITALAILAPVLWSTEANRIDVLHSMARPSSAHWFGTDQLGRDILLRTAVATRLSMVLTSLALMIAASVGISLGLLLAASTGRLRRIGASLLDTWLGFPALLFALVLLTILGPGRQSSVVTVGIAFSPYLARVTMTMASGVIGQNYVAAARLLGTRSSRILTRYVLSNVADGLVVIVFAAFGEVLIAITALSFLGLGVQPPAVDWGQLLTTGIQNVYFAPAGAIAPAIFIGATGITMAWLGDAMARAINPRLAGSQRRFRRPTSV